ncbi:MAG: hypothetical protein LCH67_19435 [Bacteroidetes bacterium]|nr:hypothetical protein [Bacteroidota bacterium]
MKYLVCIFSFFVFSLANGQSDSLTHSRLSLEIDLAPFILKGYSFSLKYSPKKFRKLALMGSVFSSDFPDAMMRKSNQKKHFTNLKFGPSFAIFSEYYFKNIKTGFYAGPAIFLYNNSVSMLQKTEIAKFKTLYPNIRLGYLWYPSKKTGFYLNPWFNVGSEINLDNKNQIEDINFEPHRLNYVLALHLGYTFNLRM